MARHQVTKLGAVPLDLDEITVEDYAVDDSVSAAEILAEADTLSNVRLWDYRPLLQTYNQIQALRQSLHSYVISSEPTSSSPLAATR